VQVGSATSGMSTGSNAARTTIRCRKSLEAEMRRREFIAGLGGSVAWPLAARAQQRPTPVVGILGSTTPEGLRGGMAAFMQGLRDAGFIPGQNVVLEQRWANDQYDRLPEMAADLVRANVSLIAPSEIICRPALPRPQLQRFRSSSRWAQTPWRWGLLPVSTGPAETLPALRPLRANSCKSGCNCSTSWFRVADCSAFF
jgi:hypothetical protein